MYDKCKLGVTVTTIKPAPCDLTSLAIIIYGNLRASGVRVAA